MIYDGILAINFVHFDGGSRTTGQHAGSGGALYVANGKVTIKKSTFEGFRAKYGGAIYVFKTSTTMTIESTTFKNNDASVRFLRHYFSPKEVFVRNVKEVF